MNLTWKITLTIGILSFLIGTILMIPAWIVDNVEEHNILLHISLIFLVSPLVIICLVFLICAIVAIWSK